MYEVIKSFKDKNNGKTYRVGDTVKFKADRATEINTTKGGPFIKEIKDEDKTEKKAKN